MIALEEAAHKAFDYCNLSYRTVEIYQGYLNKIWLPLWGNKDINCITITDIRDELQDLTDTYSASTIKMIFNSLNFVIRHTYNNKKTTLFITFKSLRLYNLKFNTKEKLINITDYEELLNYLKNSRSKNASIYAMVIQIARYTGLRLGEILALTKHDINLEENTIIINKTVSQRTVNDKIVTVISPPKTESSNRTIYVNRVLQINLINYLSTIKEDTLFTDQYGEYISPCKVSAFINYFARSHNKVITIHMLRHTFATTLLQNGAKVDIVKDLLGHLDVQTTLNLYTHRTKQDYLDTVNLIQ